MGKMTESILKYLKRFKIKNSRLNDLNELYKAFIDAQSDMVYLKDENMKYIFVNKAFSELHHKNLDEIIGYDDFELVDEADAVKRRKTDLEVADKKIALVDEVAWKDRIYRTTKFPVKLLNSNWGEGAYIRDVTEELNDKRREEKKLLRNLILVDLANQNFSSTHEQLDYVLNEALKLSESKIGYIYLYNEETREFALNSWSKDVMEECMVVEKHTKYQLEKTGLWGEAVRQRKPVIINDFEMPDAMKKGYPKGHVKLSKFMTMPVIIDNKIIAVIGLANKETNYDENDVYQINALMDGTWSVKERREAQIKLAVERKKYLLTLLSIGDGVMVVDREGKIEMLNKMAEKMTGWTAMEAKGRHYKEVFVLSHENEGAAINDPVEDVLNVKIAHELGNHAILNSRDGSRYNLEDSAAPINDDRDNTIGVVLIFRDVTEKKEQREKIEYLSFHDSLTGLYNRRFFEEEIRRLDTSRNFPISIIMGDVNGLKLTNDIFGHAEGDKLLQKAAEAIKKVCRADDIIARWGGDEFVMLLPKTKLEEAEDILLRIKNQFAKENTNVIGGSISMGCSSKNNLSEDILQIMENAEDNMYSEKTLNRNIVKSTAIETIVRTLHAESPREKEHSGRVSEMCQMIGRAMELSTVDIRKLKDAGFLHDIGKIAVDAELLNKNHSLSDQERNLIRQHPVVGYRILNSSNETLDLADSILDYHERWDGSGYPKGLKGEAISRLARIMALAESYDEMTNNCSYKKLMTRDEAIYEIQKNAGYQFDPEIVDIFVNMLKQEVQEQP